MKAAGNLLERAPGLGWSSADHPGHVLFPLFAWASAGAPSGTVREVLVQPLHRPANTQYDGAFELPAEPTKDVPARLAKPALLEVLQQAAVLEHFTANGRATALRALKAAPLERTEGVLSNKRCRHYEHAALLVACCVELEQGSGKAAQQSAWPAGVVARAARFPAFQAALRAALGHRSA